MKAVLGGIVVDRKVDNEEKHLYLVGSSIFFDMFSAFIDNRPLSGSDDVVEVSIM